MVFKVGDRVRVREDAPLHHTDTSKLENHAPASTRGLFGVVTHDDGFGDYLVDLGSGEEWYYGDEHLEPASASLSACERVLWASTQEYIRAANTEAETKREGYLRAFRQVVEEDRPELAGQQWTVQDGVFVVQQ